MTLAQVRNIGRDPYCVHYEILVSKRPTTEKLREIIMRETFSGKEVLDAEVTKYRERGSGYVAYAAVREGDGEGGSMVVAYVIPIGVRVRRGERGAVVHYTTQHEITGPTDWRPPARILALLSPLPDTEKWMRAAFWRRFCRGGV